MTFRLDLGFLVCMRGRDWLLLVPVPNSISGGRRSEVGWRCGSWWWGKPVRTGCLYSALLQDCSGEGSTLGPEGFCDQPDPFTVF